MAKRKETAAAEQDQPDFESAFARVAEIVEKLEEGNLSLRESLEAYELGVNQLKFCHAALEETERKIELLAGFDSAGNPITQPFDDAATNGEEHLGERSRETTKKTASPSPNSRASIDDSRDLF